MNFGEGCGVFGIYNHKEAPQLTYFGLYAIQHRGQESSGIAISIGNSIKTYKAMGLVSEVFNKEILEKMQSNIAIGHVRYSTTGSTSIKNAQPLSAEYLRGSVSLVHNGNLVNAHILRNNLEASGSIFQSTSDSEVIIHLIAKSKKTDFEDTVIDALTQIQGSYAILIMNENELIAARDPYGIRPLSMAKIDNGFVFSSETCAFDLIGAQFIRDIEPGEIVIINDNGITSVFPHPKTRHAFCVFEFIYYARPDSFMFGKSIHLARRNLGRNLAKESYVDADMVISVPDSGNCAAIGFAEQTKIKYDIGLVRNHYIGRTFIQPQQFIRDIGVKVKLNPVKEILQGKRIIIIDDSIVRGTTFRKTIQMIKKTGVKEIHARISSPPYRCPCFYGIDTPSQKDLIAATHSIEEIRKFEEVDSLSYLSIEGLIKSVDFPKEKMCLACFNGDYPIPIDKNMNKFILEKN